VKKILITGIMILVVAMVVLTGCSAKSTTAISPIVSPTTIATAPAVSSASVAAIEGTLENIYAKVNPSVVNISVTMKATASTGSPFSVTPQETAAEGSGWLWDTQGNIVTNNHVIANADNITITFSDGTEVPGKVVGADQDSDLAVVKVTLPSGNFVPVQLADSTQVKVGQLAIAIGNPFGLQGSMSVGIVSSVGRVISADQNATGPAYSIPDIIQTDAAINPGNSGGVLLDATGKLIGVTNSIETSSGTSSGVGFAIPAEIVQKVVPSLISTGTYSHPYLGATILSLNANVADAMGLPVTQRGALVEAVAAGGPAEQAGLKAGTKTITVSGGSFTVGGDIIIALDGQSVKTSDDLISLLAKDTVGQKISLTILRDGKDAVVVVTLGSRPLPSSR
jgi:S1-C subfamily serine protease